MKFPKFRGKTNDGYWYTGNLMIHDLTPYIVYWNDWNNYIWQKVLPNFIAEYTNIIDIKENEIYTGDIFCRFGINYIVRKGEVYCIGCGHG